MCQWWWLDKMPLILTGDKSIYIYRTGNYIMVMVGFVLINIYMYNSWITLTFSQFSGALQITAGDGLEKSGNTLSIDAKSNSGIVIDSNELSLDLGRSSITLTLAVSDGGTGATTLNDLITHKEYLLVSYLMNNC